jgi:DNA-directed RNA polymerase subunit beta
MKQMPLSLARTGKNGPSLASYAKISKVLDVPNLIQMQINSFEWLRNSGLSEVLREVSPIQDFTSNKFELYFEDHAFKDPKYSPEECKDKEITYSASLWVKTRLVTKETGVIKEQEIFMGDLPIMTDKGTFVVNGAERVVVSQLVRSPGVYFVLDKDTTSSRKLCSVKLIPYRGAWLELETSSKNIISVKVDRKRKVAVTTFFRALGIFNDEEIVGLFSKVDKDPDRPYMQSTLDKDGYIEEMSVNFKTEDLKKVWSWLHPDKEFDDANAKKIANAQLEFYRRLRPGEPPSLDNAYNLIRNLLFEPRRYDLNKVGRHKLNARLNLKKPLSQRVLDLDDLIAIVRTMIELNNGIGKPDDIDHLGNRRVRSVGELVQNQMRVGLLRMERMVKERMTLIDPEAATPQALVNIRPVVASVREFFGGSQLSQFMDQTNPLAELTHKRRLSALGPGGLSRERAGFDVRDVHFSHYGRICPIETPEGPNIGLLSSLASYARINSFGFIESPYRRVFKELNNTDEDLLGRNSTELILDDDGTTIVRAGSKITTPAVKKLSELSKRKIAVRPFVSVKEKDIVYLSADVEETHIIAQANIPLDKKAQIIGDRVEVRDGDNYAEESADHIDYMDVSPMQIMSISASLIPFLEHDDANRALMGSNMQRQAVPLLRPQAPLIGTGIEGRVAQDSGQVVLCELDGVVSSVTGTEVVVSNEQNGNNHSHRLTKFSRTNQGTCFNQRAIVDKGQLVAKGDVLADSSSTEQGELALGRNVLVAFMSWGGYNYEDAIILSEDLVKRDCFTSIHVEKHEMESRETKLGPEEITQDIPNVGEESLMDLDERGIIRIGANVGPGDILVGKVTPKGETELTAEEKLLRAIFGEKSRDVKDTSLRVPHGERGKVIAMKILSKEDKDELPAAVNEAVRVWVAQTRKISVGDKMAGRHGNKGVVARVLPVEDMPYLPDGTPVDIILNPIGVPSRMNLGQVLETHLGWVAKHLNFKAVTPIFDGATDIAIEDGLARIWFLEQSGSLSFQPGLEQPEIDLDRAGEWLKTKGYDPESVWDLSVTGEAGQVALKIWLESLGVSSREMDVNELQAEALRLQEEERLAPPTFGKTILYDGQTGEQFGQPVTVGYIYMLKLVHLVEDKIHARSTGPYSLITQQPLGGKAQFGGQRFGEMEVWALEAYSAAYNLQEVLTVKSDDVSGRVKTYEAIVKGEDIVEPGIPESFNVLVKELQSLGLAVELLHEEGPTGFTPESDKTEELSDLEQIEALVGAKEMSDETELAKAALLTDFEKGSDQETSDEKKETLDTGKEDEVEALSQAGELAEDETLIETDGSKDTTE